MERPRPMKVEQARKGLYTGADDDEWSKYTGQHGTARIYK
jgi:hypothetical protein